MAMTAAGLRLNWIGKHTLFKPPLGWFLKWLGGIPVNRSVSSNFVDQVITFFREREQLIVAISPEGTRKHTDHWKSGFYYIALGARVPLILGFVDYGRRIAGVGKLVELSGETERDLEEIRSFYANITPRYPENFGEIAMRKRSERSAPDG